MNKRLLVRKQCPGGVNQQWMRTCHALVVRIAASKFCGSVISRLQRIKVGGSSPASRRTMEPSGPHTPQKNAEPIVGRPWLPPGPSVLVSITEFKETSSPMNETPHTKHEPPAWNDLHELATSLGFEITFETREIVRPPTPCTPRAYDSELPPPHPWPDDWFYSENLTVCAVHNEFWPCTVIQLNGGYTYYQPQVEHVMVVRPKKEQH